MSLYNKLFGVNPYATSLLLILGGPEVPRFGDCYLNEASEIVIVTRTGGNNREAYKAENAALTQVPGYLRDEDDGFDHTYAYFFFAAPEDFADAIAEIKTGQGPRDPMGGFRKLIEDMKTGRETPAVAHALDVGRQILSKVEKAANGKGPHIIEV